MFVAPSTSERRPPNLHRERNTDLFFKLLDENILVHASVITSIGGFAIAYPTIRFEPDRIVLENHTGARGVVHPGTINHSVPFSATPEDKNPDGVRLRMSCIEDGSVIFRFAPDTTDTTRMRSTYLTTMEQRVRKKLENHRTSSPHLN